MATIARLYVEMGMDKTGLSRGLQAAKNDLRGLDDGLGSTTKKAGLLGKTLGGIGTVAGGILGAAAIGGLFEVGKGFLMANANAEQYRMQLETVTGSQEKANALFKDLQAFAASTPFEFPELVNASIQLESFGMNTKDWIGTIGDTAAATGKSLDQVTQAVLDASTGEYERLKELGIKASVEGDKLKLRYMENGKEIVEVVDKNNQEIILSTVQGIWNRKYEGAMEKQSKTFLGQWSTLKDNISLLMQEATKPLFELSKRGLDFANKLFGAFGKNRAAGMSVGMALFAAIQKVVHETFGADALHRVTVFMRTLVEGFHAAVKVGKIVLSVLVVAFQGLLKVLGFVADHFDVIAPIAAVLVGKFLLFAKVIPMVMNLQKVFMGLRLALLGLTGPFGLIIAAIALFAVAYSKNWLGIRDKTQTAIAFILKWFAKFVDFVQPAIDTVITLFTYLKDVLSGDIAPGDLAKIPGWLQPIAAVLGRVTKTLRVFFKTWQDKGFLAALKTIPTQIRAFGRAFAGLFDAIGLSRFADGVRRQFVLIGAMFGNIVDLIDDLIHGRWSQVWGDLGRIALTAIQFLVNNARMAIGLLLDVFTAIPWGQVFAGIWGAVQAIPWADIGTALLNGLIAAVQFMADTGIPFLLAKGGELIGALWTGMQTFWAETLQPWLLGIAGSIVGAILTDDTTSQLYDLGRSIISWIWTGIASLLDWLLIMAHEIPNTIIGSIGNMYGWFYNTGRDMISGIWDGFASLRGWVITMVGDWVDGVVATVKEKLGIASPSKVFAAFGKQTVLGFADGVLGSAHVARNAVADALAFDGASVEATVSTPRLSAMPAVAGAGAGAMRGGIVVNNTINGAGDPDRVAELVVRRTMRAIRRTEAGVA